MFVHALFRNGGSNSLLTIIDFLPQTILQLHLTNDTSFFFKSKLTLYKHAHFRSIFHYVTCEICDYNFYFLIPIDYDFYFLLSIG